LFADFDYGDFGDRACRSGTRRTVEHREFTKAFAGSDFADLDVVAAVVCEDLNAALFDNIKMEVLVTFEKDELTGREGFALNVRNRDMLG
jgi:hypothetical protein